MKSFVEVQQLEVLRSSHPPKPNLTQSTNVSSIWMFKKDKETALVLTTRQGVHLSIRDSYG